MMAANPLAGANLTGALLQPSYLSMPVGVGNGQSGYLQIPTGNPAGRTSYLQIPVNTGYGPPSYLQIELGRKPASTVQDPGPTPGPNPLGSTPRINIPTTNSFAYDIPKTASDDLPPIVPTVQGNSAQAIAVARSEPSAVKPASAAATPKVLVATQQTLQESASLTKKDTSFSLIDDDSEAPTLAASDRKQSSPDELPPVAVQKDSLLVAK